MKLGRSQETQISSLSRLSQVVQLEKANPFFAIHDKFLEILLLLVVP